MKHDFKVFPNLVFIETGSYIGDGIQAALDANCFDQIISIELSSYYHELCKKRFEGNKKIQLFLGESIIVLPEIMKVINNKCTFWIDAHCCGGFTAQGEITIPIIKELEIIGKHWIKEHTILIDDMRSVGHGFPNDGWNDIKIAEIEETIYQINKEYKITYDFGMVENDIMIAQI